jgi:D-alanyl-D-alanine dipeptidase
MSDLSIRPVPKNLPDGLAWKELPIADSREKLVPLGPFAQYGVIFTSAIYFGEHDNSPYVNESALPNALITMFVRESVAKRLVQAQKLLPDTCRLVVFDSYRTLGVQGSLFDAAKSELHRRHPEWGPEQLSAETQRFVSAPSNDTDKPAPHNTGGPVDLAIVKLAQGDVGHLCDIEQRLESIGSRTGAEATQLEFQRSAILRRATLLDFGSAFDHVGEEATPGHFERLSETRALSSDENLALNNRRLLNTVMTEAGFLPYAEEWWHFNPPESQMGGWMAGLQKAAFGSIELSEENLRWEDFRRHIHYTAIKIRDAAAQGVSDALGPGFDGLRKAVMATGDERRSGSSGGTNRPFAKSYAAD